MKDYNIGKWTKRFMLIVCLCISYSIIMETLDEFYLMILRERPVIDETIDADEILSMSEFGLDYNEVRDSHISKIDSRLDTNGYTYELHINNDNVHESTYISITYHKFSSVEKSNLYYDLLLPSIYNNYYDMFVKNPFETQLKDTDLNYEQAIKVMIELDSKEWNADRVYSLHELFTGHLDRIILQKDENIMIMTISANGVINESHLPILTKVSTKIDALLEASIKE